MTEFCCDTCPPCGCCTCSPCMGDYDCNEGLLNCRCQVNLKSMYLSSKVQEAITYIDRSTISEEYL